MLSEAHADWLFGLLGFLVLVPPTLLIAVLGLPMLFGRPLDESRTSRVIHGTVVCGLGAALSVLAAMLLLGRISVSVELGHWVVISPEHFHFHLKFVFDRLSVPFLLLSYLLCGVVGAFANRYLHREPGYQRFHFCYALFMAGMVMSSLAGTIETLFVGWELVGLSSALLVAFFHERILPARNGLRVWTVYRLSDALFLMAAVTMHHLTGEGDFAGLMGNMTWPEGDAALTSEQALLVGGLLLVAAAGKSALVPFCGWLPRAMEGPTPSSAIFYGALSVHLGAFLLLRVGPILSLSWILSGLVILFGLATALLASAATRVQADIKTALAFASLTQVGIIVAEIGAGFRYVALIHLIGHACLRTLQLLRAPNVLQDHHAFEEALGTTLSHGHSAGGIREPSVWERWFYRFAWERGYLDTLLDDYLVRPFVRVFRGCDRWERAWTDWLAGTASREPPPAEPAGEVVRELSL